jgi:hypothetical protein
MVDELYDVFMLGFLQRSHLVSVNARRQDGTSMQIIRKITDMAVIFNFDAQIQPQEGGGNAWC